MTKIPNRIVVYVGYGLITLLIFGFTEIISSFLPQLIGTRTVIGRLLYRPPSISREAYDEYMTIRDPQLGWPARRASNDMIMDSSGARPSPAFPEPSHACVSLYGDSYVYGDEVTDEEAWGNILARRLGCRVGNFGVRGYGTDQALLRFVANTNDSAPFTVLGVYADNPLRNVNQYRYFLTGGDPRALKPRFIFDKGLLKLAPIPELSFDEFEAALKNPKTVWRYEWFLPGSDDGPVVWSFPYTLSVTRLMISHQFAEQMESLRDKQPSWIAFYEDSHPSGALRITTAIIEEFQRVAKQRGKRMLVLTFPSPSGFKHFRRTGVSPFQPLIAALDAKGCQARDLSEDFTSYLNGRSFCEINSGSTCMGHFNFEGNMVVAKVVHEYMIANGLIPKSR